MDGGACWATVHGVTKNGTRLSDFTFFLSFKGREMWIMDLWTQWVKEKVGRIERVR